MDAVMLDVRRLTLLRELQLRGTIAAVASSLNLSPSAVSQQLSVLEREVGIPLLRKAGRRVVLTQHAELLVAHTELVLTQLELAETGVQVDGASTAGTVTIATFQSAALGILPGALSILAAEHPDLRVHVTQREPETALHETWLRDFDLVVAEEYPHHSARLFRGLDRQPLMTDALRLAVPRGSAISSIADAADAAWVMEPPGTASRHFAEQTCRAAGVEPDVRFETADLGAHVRLVESGNAVGILPDLIWAHHVPRAVDLIELPGAPRRTIFTAARDASAGRSAIIACRSALANVALEEQARLDARGAEQAPDHAAASAALVARTWRNAPAQATT
jgi:DNA-binding transcriptional LysR family regulator